MRMKEILAKARYLIYHGWTQGCEARDIDGDETWIGSPTACKFCLTGAIIKAGAHGGLRADCYHHLRTMGGINVNLVTWNDTPGRKKWEVLELLDNSIRRLV